MDVLSRPGRNAWQLSPRDWGLRTRLAVVLLMPAVLAVALGGLRAADQITDAGELDRVVRYALAQDEVSTLIEYVQQERFDATNYVARGRTGDRATTVTTITVVDGALATARPIVGAIRADDVNGNLVRTDQPALVAARLPQLRELVFDTAAPPTTVVARYSEVVDQLLLLNTTLLLGVNTSEVTAAASRLAELAEVRNEATLQLTLVGAATTSVERPDAALRSLADSDARLGAGLARFQSSLAPDQRVQYADLISGAANSDRALFLQRLQQQDTGPAPLPTVVVDDASARFDTFLGEIDSAEEQMRTEVLASSQTRRQQSTDLATLNIALLVLALLVSTIVITLVARTMITSLGALRHAALDIAHRRLPEAVRRMRNGEVPEVNVDMVPVASREEVGQVARAFDAVHTQALRLAAEQAALQSSVNSVFVNLSRRTQSLADRQLQLIEALESNEQDPDQLSHLFRLDHLATRMRRNSENLLVLAGTSLAPRSARPVPLLDVMQAALSEVEHYERIDVDFPPQVTIAGRAASDVQHLLAELLDNATSFSPPHTRVRMIARHQTTGPVVVQIIDRGVGMPADKLRLSNATLADPGGVSVSTSRQMGLFVVARLANRHDIHVRLAGAAGGGIVSRIALPDWLFDTGRDHHR